MKGKTFFVTGGNTGIGFCTAQLFARLGANISILSVGEDVNTEACRQIEALGASCLAITGDVTREADVAAAVHETVERFGGIHYCFNNAGVSQPSGLLQQQTMDQFQRIMDINVKGVWLSLKHEISAVIRSGGGAIVNSSSHSGVEGVPKQAIYCASKHAVVGLTRSAALDHARDGVRINAIAPGVVNTEMIQRYARENADLWPEILKRHPMGVTAEPEEVAAAVLFLCRDATKTTGAVFNIDCGMIAG
jgi:NAD(P)-dependent dehydrogenase (short-subunit alcohol dehydrogenase family)